MTTKEAIQAMLDGKKIDCKEWGGLYIYFDGKSFKNECKSLIDSNYVFNVKDDWEIYEEPKPKQTVVIEKWLCECDYSHFVLEGNENFFKEADNNMKRVKLLDTYEVELP